MTGKVGSDREVEICSKGPKPDVRQGRCDEASVYTIQTHIL